MKRNLKKVMTIFLTFLLVFGALPTGSFADSSNLEISNPGADNVTKLPPSLTNGAIWTDKSVVYDGNGEFTVTLKAIGQNYKKTVQVPGELVDVVLVVDVSGSMKENNRLINMKTAANNAVDILLGVQGNRVAVVKYSGMASQVSGFSSDATTLKSGINGLSADGGTNIQNAFLVAQNLIKDRSAGETNKPVIILMSDGRPTYYHESLADQTLSNRLGNGSSTNTTGTFVWQTIRQAMQAKTEISDLEIYTIGFGVGSDAYAIATLIPDEENTAAYRPGTYSGETRTATQTGVVQYESESSNSGNAWSGWNPSEEWDVGYVAPVYDPATGTWSSFSGMTSSPKNNWGTPVTNGDIYNTSYTDNSGNNRRKIGYFNVTRSGTEYQNVVSVKEPFNHKYWEDGSTITNDNATAIFNAFVSIVSQLVDNKPTSYISNGAGHYSDIVIEDVLGNEFELSGDLPPGVAQSGNTLTWTIDGDEFTTLPADSTTIDPSKINQVSFQVKLKSSASLGGPYYTNASAQGSFTAGADNPEYTGNKDIVQPLLNRGKLSLVCTDVNATIAVTKTVSGPAGWTDSADRTFTFSFYYTDPSQPGGGGTPLVSTPLSIAVNGADSKTETQALTIPASAFGGGNSLTLYVKENQTAPDADWTYDSVKTVTISKNAAAGSVNFVNEYHPKGTLKVTKAWSGNGPEGEVSFKLQKEAPAGEWSDVSTGHLLDANNGWTTQISGLTLGVNYRVVEDTTSDLLYDYAASYSKESVTFDGSNLQENVVITNAYKQPVGKITVKKIWNHGENPVTDRPTQVFYNYDGPDAGTEADGQLILTGATNAAFWTGAIEVVGDGKFGTYTFTEVVPADYEADKASQSATISLTPPASREATLTFTNTYIVPKGSLTVTKEWANEGGDERFRPAAVTIGLFKDDGAGGKTTVASINLPESDETPWSHNFTNLALGTYSVEEIGQVPDYTTSYSAASVELTKANRHDGITVTNTFDNPKGTITVDKVWVEGGLDTTVVQPGQIKVSLMKGAAEVDSITLPKSGNDWTHTFTDLDLDGTYTVIESAVNSEDALKLANYTKDIIYGGDGGSEVGVTLTSTERSGCATITNTYAKGTITVYKSWVDKYNPVTELPQSAIVTLWKVTRTPILEESILAEGNAETGLQPLILMELNGFSTTSAAIGSKTITRPNSAVVFYDLEMDENISYYVSEDEIPFYDTSYSVDPLDPDEYLVLGYDEQNSPNGQITVTNTYMDPRGSLTVNKVWEHGNNPDSAWPESVSVQLRMNGDAVGEPVTLSGNSWSYTFDGLTLGAVYTVTEEPLDNYSTTYGSITGYTPVKDGTTVAGGTITVTNTYIPEVGSLTVEKKWVGTTGGAITATLSRYYDVEGTGTKDDSFSRSEVLNSGNGWSHTFTGLELYGPGGVPYSYKATESGDLALYTQTNNDTPTLHQDGEATITITNTYAPNQGRLTITKEWLDENGGPMEHPPVESIQVRLIVNGKAEGSTMELNADNHWTVERSPLSVDSPYWVEEVNGPEEFAVTYDGTNPVRFTSQDLAATITIKNQRTTDVPSIRVEKTVAKDNAVLVDGKATFDYTVKVTNTGNRTLRNISILDTMTKPTGASITYFPTPPAIQGGSALFTHQGSLKPNESVTLPYSVQVDRAGDYNNLAHVTAWYGNTEITGEGSATVNVKAPGLSIIKSVVGPDLITGSSGTFTYQLLVRNDGEVDLENVKIKDVFSGSPGVAYDYAGSIPADPVTGTFTIGTLEKGAKDIVITYKVSMNSTGTYHNVATVKGDYKDPNQLDELQQPILVSLEDSDDADVTIRQSSNPPRPPRDNPPVVIPDTPVPQGPTNPEVILPEDEIPEGPALPKTGGGMDPSWLYGLGALLIGGGLGLRRKKEK